MQKNVRAHTRPKGNFLAPTHGSEAQGIGGSLSGGGRKRGRGTEGTLENLGEPEETPETVGGLKVLGLPGRCSFRIPEGEVEPTSECACTCRLTFPSLRAPNFMILQ